MQKLIDFMKSLVGGAIFFTVSSLRRTILTINKFILAIGLSTLIFVLGSALSLVFLGKLIVTGISQPEIISAGLMALAVLEYCVLSLCVFIVAAPILYLITDSAAAFFVGAKEAREHGLMSLLSKTWDVIRLRDLQVAQEIINIPVANQGAASANQLLALFGISHRVTISNFDSIKLSDEDMAALVAHSPAALSEGDAGFNHHRYTELKNLNTATTAILFEQVPNSLNAESYDANNPPILVCKQYKKDNIWHAVPMFSRIYFKNEIKEWFERDAICPVTRDPITAPTPYTDNGVQCETRYVWHPYYLESAPNGVCQERNELILTLRENPAAVVAEMPAAAAEVVPVPTIIDLRLGGTRFSIHGAPVAASDSQLAQAPVQANL